MRLGGQDADESSVAGIDRPSEAQVEVVWKIHSLMWNFHNLPFGTLNCTAVVSARMIAVVPIHPLECHMSKRKPATTSKHARSPKVAAKAQRTTQAIVRSPKVRRSSVAGGLG